MRWYAPSYPFVVHHGGLSPKRHSGVKWLLYLGERDYIARIDRGSGSKLVHGLFGTVKAEERYHFSSCSGESI